MILKSILTMMQLEPINTPKDIEELKNQLYQIKSSNGKFKVFNNIKFSFKKVRTFLSSKKQ